MKKKIRVAVIFGGRSAEHEVSLVSASGIMQALDRTKYEVVPVGISREGRWLRHDQALKMLKLDQLNTHFLALPSPDPTAHDILVAVKDDKTGLPVLQQQEKIDVIFPVLHGTFGEDGTVQGLFELMDVPYVGAGVLGSAIGMDKVVQKQLFRYAGLPVVNFLFFIQANNPLDRKESVAEIEAELTYPIFVKPVNLGSSVGISKVNHRQELFPAIAEAFRYDRKIILEQGVMSAREIEISVLGNDQPRVSLPGEIIPSREFYDYRAKYEDGASKLEIPAKLPEETIRQIQAIALRAFQVTDCAGMARIDFLLTTEKISLSEINTIPGFTAISMYPKLWEMSGLPFPQLLDELIRLAVERHEQKQHLQTRARQVSDWYQKE